MEQIFNFRDFGGYQTSNGKRVKKGLLFRSGTLAQATDDDLMKISDLGIKTIIDFRNQREKDSHPDRLPKQSHINYVQLPIRAIKFDKGNYFYKVLLGIVDEIVKRDYVAVTIKAYQDYATAFREEYSSMLKLMTDTNNFPILIHCTAGKDRTGVGAALIHSILDVPYASIMEDYLESNQNLQPYKDQMLKKFEFFGKFGFTETRFLPLFEARESYLDATLEAIDTAGTMIKEHILETFNLSISEQKQIASKLLA